MFNIARKILYQPLYLNSLYLISGTGVLAVFGFVYWWLAARLTTSYNVGIATILVSVMTYIGIISQVGLNISIIKFLPVSTKPSEKINTSLTVVSIVALLASIIFILISDRLQNTFSFIRNDSTLAFWFIVFMIFAAMNVFFESLFIALRSSQNVLIRNIFLSVMKVGFLFIFLPLGGYGIFSSWTTAIIITVIISFILLPLELKRKLKIQVVREELKEMAGFSLGNYVASLIGNLAVNAIPLVITIVTNLQNTAYYAIAMSIASLLFSIPYAICNSLFAEGAADKEKIRINTTKAIKLIGILLIPAILVLILFGRFILLIFGVEYAQNSALLLSMFAVSSIFVSINTVCWTLLNLNHRVVDILITLTINAFIILALTYLFLQNGILGVGYAWLIGQAVTSMVYFIFTYRKLHHSEILKVGIEV